MLAKYLLTVDQTHHVDDTAINKYNIAKILCYPNSYIISKLTVIGYPRSIFSI